LIAVIHDSWVVSCTVKPFDLVLRLKGNRKNIVPP
jgi:hypothetical protein